MKQSQPGLTLPSKTPALLAGLACGCVAAIAWSAADMLLVGTVPRPQDFPLFSTELAARINHELAVLMLGATPQRLDWGVYLATFSVVLYLLSVTAIRRLLPGTLAARLCCLMLFVGFALSPLGHAGFAYIGLLARPMLGSSGAVLEAQILALQQAEHLLDVHWLASVLASAIGWTMLLVFVALGRSTLPRWSAIITPLPLVIILALACMPFANAPLGRLIGGASINLAQLVFFSTALALCLRRRRPD